jgi:hypothetical protein
MKSEKCCMQHGSNRDNVRSCELFDFGRIVVSFKFGTLQVLKHNEFNICIAGVLDNSDGRNALDNNYW